MTIFRQADTHCNLLCGTDQIKLNIARGADIRTTRTKQSYFSADPFIRLRVKSLSYGLKITVIFTIAEITFGIGVVYVNAEINRRCVYPFLFYYLFRSTGSRIFTINLVSLWSFLFIGIAV